MTNIRIDRTKSTEYEELDIEINDADEDTISYVLRKTFRETDMIENLQTAENCNKDYERQHGTRYNIIRRMKKESFLLDEIIAAKKEGKLDKFISPFDEIDIPLDTGGYVTVVCAYSNPNTARFVFKDCWDEGVMNEETTTNGGYYKSKGREHVLVDILPKISQEWRDIFKPRKMVEEIDGERIEYADPMWLLSATDVFGPSPEGYWRDIDDSFQFQLPIFQRMRDRVKECGDKGTYPYWLRSVDATSSNIFRLVVTGGGCSFNGARWLNGFAPGFDI